MNLNLIKIVGVAVGVAGMTVETRAAEMQEYVAERDNTQVSVWKSHRPEKTFVHFQSRRGADTTCQETVDEYEIGMDV